MSQPDPDSPRTFRFQYEVPVRFRDLDPMGHAHHSLPLVYIEEARAAYWRDVAGRAASLDGIDYIMAQVTLRFLQRIHFPDTLRIGVRVSRLGTTSFTMEYEIRSASGEVLVTAETVQVIFDYERERPKPIPEDVREKISAFEE
jgi:acyl-CoA thioester hydrolase